MVTFTVWTLSTYSKPWRPSGRLMRSAADPGATQHRMTIRARRIRPNHDLACRPDRRPRVRTGRCDPDTLSDHAERRSPRTTPPKRREERCCVRRSARPPGVGQRALAVKWKQRRVATDLRLSCTEDCAIGLSARLDEHCQRGGYLGRVPEAYSHPIGNAAKPARLVHRICGFQR